MDSSTQPSSVTTKILIIFRALIFTIGIAIALPISALLLGTVLAVVISATGLVHLGEYGAWLGVIFGMYAAYADIVIVPVLWWRLSAKRLCLAGRISKIGTIGVGAVFSLVLLWTLWGEQAIGNAPHLEDVSDDGHHVLALVMKSGGSSLYKLDTESGVANLLVKDPKQWGLGYASFSPDAKLITFAESEDEKNYRIMIADVNGKDVHPLLRFNGNDSWPRFSRDGQEIYFVRTDGNGFDLFSSTLDGKNVTQLTHQHYTFSLGPYLQSVPALSSNRKQMLLTAEESLKLCSLWGANQQPSNILFQLPNSPSSRIYVSGYFSSDDKGVVFMAASEGKDGYAYDVYQLESATHDLKKLTENNGYASDFRLSVGGTRAAFLKWKMSRLQKLPRSYELQLMDMQSGVITPVRIAGLPG